MVHISLFGAETVSAAAALPPRPYITLQLYWIPVWSSLVHPGRRTWLWFCFLSLSWSLDLPGVRGHPSLLLHSSRFPTLYGRRRPVKDKGEEARDPIRALLS